MSQNKGKTLGTNTKKAIRISNQNKNEKMDKFWKNKVEDIEANGIVTIYVNAFGNEDSDGDISMPGSFTKTINEFFHRVKWHYNHDRKTLLGVPLDAVQDNYGLKIRGQLNLKKELGRDTYEDYKLYAEHGKTLEHSVGVYPIKRDEQEYKKVLEWKLFEYSTLTTLAANERAITVDIKSEEQIDNIIDTLEIMLKGNYSEQRAKKIEEIYNTYTELRNEFEPQSTQTEEPPKGTQHEILKYLSNKLKHL